MSGLPSVPPTRGGNDGSSPVADDRLRRAEGVWSGGVQDRTVLYSTSECKAIVLNATGAALWDALESPRRPSELAGLLIQRFPQLTRERADADVIAFLDRLVREGVLQPHS